MWRLVKDHLLRNRRSITLWAPFMGFMLFLTAYGEHAKFAGHFAYTQLYLYGFIFSINFATTNPDVARVWRVLPFRESALERLIWCIATLLTPALLFLLALLVELGFFCWGRPLPAPIAWPSFLLLMAALTSGTLAFGYASISRGLALAMEARNAHGRWSLSTSYATGPIIALVVMGGAAFLLFYPVPTGWSDLTPRHFLGMCMAAGLTWKSYRMRRWLLRFDSIQKSAAHVTPKKENAPTGHGSALSGLTQEWKATIKGTLRVLLGFIGIGYLSLFGVAWTGLAPRDGDGYLVSATVLTVLLVMLAALLVLFQIARIAHLKALRSMPLTGSQCILLALSYPFVVAVAVIPCTATTLWLTGYGSLPTLLISGTLFCAGLCPFAMFIFVRFGSNGLTAMTAIGGMGTGYSIVATALFNEPFSSPSRPILWAGALLLAILGVWGYWGLRHLIENSSAVYKRKLLPQQFGQGLGR